MNAAVVSVAVYHVWLVEQDNQLRAVISVYNRLAKKLETNVNIIYEAGWMDANEAVIGSLYQVQADLRGGPLPPPEYRVAAGLLVAVADAVLAMVNEWAGLFSSSSDDEAIQHLIERNTRVAQIKTAYDALRCSVRLADAGRVN